MFISVCKQRKDKYKGVQQWFSLWNLSFSIHNEIVSGLKYMRNRKTRDSILVKMVSWQLLNITTKEMCIKRNLLPVHRLMWFTGSSNHGQIL